MAHKLREQTRNMRLLLQEFMELKNKIFGRFSFVIVEDEDTMHKRYNQLFMFFYPEYRTKNFISPLPNEGKVQI